ncbi:TPA: AAA family ATPase [Pseudomonas aeruginosa]|nr:AAA family ATPase [Pseudomonas aeruginosa]
MLKELKIANIGPADAELEFGTRLNLITGDNGLGKSFLLDIAWWAMTRKWPAEINPRLTAGKVALPTDKKRKAEIGFSFTGISKTKANVIDFEPRLQNWNIPRGRPANPGMVFYAMADGSFAVWDPARNYWKNKTEESLDRPPAYVFSPKEVWDGLQREDGTWLCNGLIRDWAGWQKEKGRAFDYLVAVLSALSPSSTEQLQPGALTRISLDDVRDMPTLKMPYGQDVAVVHASSGMRRIISLSYFLVWCWEEHLKAKELLGEEPETKTTFLIDEVESHLHPRWQRTVIPALMHVMAKLNTSAEVQLIAVTHSPLVMASVEPQFDDQKDAWWDLDLVQPSGGEPSVKLTKRQFVRLGEVSRWLMSDAFDMGSARSLEAEEVLQQAAKILSEEVIDTDQAKALDAKLRTLLGDTDPFWIRWRYVGEKQGWLE